MHVFAPIVEGHGEVHSIRLLIERVWSTLGRDDWPRVLAPIRHPKGKLVKPRELKRAVELAALKLAQTSASHPVILLLLDADEDCAAELGPELLEAMKSVRSDLTCLCAIAVNEYETWFVAGAEGMSDMVDLPAGGAPEDPESTGLGKGWIQRHFASGRYSETADQPRLTARLDVNLARKRSPSFDRFCRMIEEAGAGE